MNVQVAGGPKIKDSQTIEMEAYDKFTVTIEDGETDKEIQIIPGTNNNTSFLVIRSDKYNNTTDAAVNLNFKVNGTGNPFIDLDAPFFLIGKGATGMLDSGNAPQKFFFSNSLGTAANIEILVGRESTP